MVWTKTQKKGLEPSQLEAEVVTGGSKDGVGAVAVVAFEVVSAHAVLAFEVTYYRLDCGLPLHLPPLVLVTGGATETLRPDSEGVQVLNEKTKRPIQLLLTHNVCMI